MTITASRSWLAPAAEAAAADLAAWYAARPRSIFTLANVLPQEEAAHLRAALHAHRCWTHSRHIDVPGNTTSEATPEAWAAATPGERFSSHFVLRPIGALIPPEGIMAAAHRRALMRFARAALVEPELRDWASAIVGIRLDGRVGCELARYGEGDFIAPHTDHYDGRSLAFVLYLDDCDARSGGLLHFCNEAGIETIHPPRFNHAALIPIHPDCRHWVSPWQRAEPGRETISLAFRAAS
ncbi:2OG-Fe(II) oxygenase [Sphingomonas pituitosa]|uniref:2OG-Fe(II) oxygenase n=1 Tax=Sphingomonas pituitosa TaxID=99597 RepID=UPI00082FD1C3|nr:2OG-Fe(II) oxygenase [Sphingomonas pituitosa]